MAAGKRHLGSDNGISVVVVVVVVGFVVVVVIIVVVVVSGVVRERELEKVCVIQAFS